MKIFFKILILSVCCISCTQLGSKFGGNISTSQKLPEWWQNREITQTKNNWIFQLGNNLYYDYYVDSVKYKNSKNFSQGYLKFYSINLNYRIYYDKNNPINHVIAMHEPILEEHNINKLTICSMTHSGTNEFIGSAFFSIQFRFFNNPNAKQNGLHGPRRFSRYFYDTLPYVTHPNHHVYPLKYTFDDPYIFEPIWDQPFSKEATGTRLVSPMANDYPEKDLTKAARELGDGGVIYWMPREQPLKQASPKMNKFLETYQPKDKEGNIIDVEIVIVDHEFIDKLNDNSSNK